MRGIDHLVLPVHNLAAAGETFRNLGFSTTPEARHPFGTGNILVQMQASFLEFVAVVDPGKISAGTPDRFSFAEHTQAFLKERGEGFSMLVLDSTDAAGDRKAFLDAGLKVYEPFSFERSATQPDGSVGKVAFSLTIVADPETPGTGFFTCHNLYPDTFWKAAYQTHPNTAHNVASITLVSPEPSRHIPFLSAFAGSEAIETGEDWAKVSTARGALRVMTAESFEARNGFAAGIAGPPSLAAYEIAVTDLGATKRCLEAADIRYHESDTRLVVAPGEAHCTVLEFSQI